MLPAPTPDLVQQAVTYSDVNPSVLYGNLLGTIAAFITASLGVWSSYMNRKRIQEVHILVNSQFAAYKAAVAEILVLEKERSREIGEREGRRDERVEQMESKKNEA